MSTVSSSPAASISLPGCAEAALVGLLIGLGLYGIYCVLFSITIHVLCFRRRRRPLNRILLGVSILLFLLATMDIVLLSQRAVRGLLHTPSGYTLDLFFAADTDIPSVVAVIGSCVTILIADAVLIYRLWLVWQKRWPFIIFNALVWIANVASSIVLIQAMPSTDPSKFALKLNWAIISESLTVVQTVVATTLISLRLWRIDRRARNYREDASSLLPIMRILVESGALYTTLMIVSISFDAANPAGSVALMPMECVVIGIAFSLIIVRVGLGLTIEAQTTTQTATEESADAMSIHVDIRRTTGSRDEAAGDNASALEEGEGSLSMKPIGKDIHRGAGTKEQGAHLE